MLYVVCLIDSDLLIFMSSSRYINGFGEHSLIVSAGGMRLYYFTSSLNAPSLYEIRGGWIPTGLN